MIPAAIRQSPFLTQGGGFRVYSGLPDAASCAALLGEALAVYPQADHQQCEDDDGADGRGGRPRRRLLTAQAGDVQDDLYRSTWLPAQLSDQFGLPIVPSGNRGSYSYYVRAGDFLDLHLDVEACDVAMITSLYDNTPPTDPRGALVLYPTRIGEPLSSVRARPRAGAHFVKLRPGETIVMFGGIVPHRVLPVADGQHRIISVLCYQAVV